MHRKLLIGIAGSVGGLLIVGAAIAANGAPPPAPFSKSDGKTLDTMPAWTAGMDANGHVLVDAATGNLACFPTGAAGPDRVPAASGQPQAVQGTQNRATPQEAQIHRVADTPGVRSQAQMPSGASCDASSAAPTSHFTRSGARVVVPAGSNRHLPNP